MFYFCNLKYWQTKHIVSKTNKFLNKEKIKQSAQ